MKVAIFTAIISFAFLAKGVVFGDGEDVTLQEINQVMGDFTKYLVTVLLKEKTLDKMASDFLLSVKTDNIDVRVFPVNGHLVVEGLTSQSQTSSLSDPNVSVNFNLKFGPLGFLGNVRIEGTINEKPINSLTLISMIASDPSIYFEMKAKYDAWSVQVVDMDAKVSYKPTITLSSLKIEEKEELEKAIEEALEKQVEGLQKAIEKAKPDAIDELNDSWKEKNLRDLIELTEDVSNRLYLYDDEFVTTKSSKFKITYT